MCTVVGYVGRKDSRRFLIDGLSRLEYRGYDSAGVACLSSHDNRLLFAKTQGGLQQLCHKLEQSPLDGFLGIGHTRWSTHGPSIEKNAHPQFDCDNTISIVHNGIIENHHEIRLMLEASGHVFSSDTDTEVIAHLLELFLKTHKTCKSAIVDVLSKLMGAYAFVAIMQSEPDYLLLVRRRSPLCIGIGDGEMFVASDPLAFAGRTHKVLFMPDQSFALVSKDTIHLFDFQGNPLALSVEHFESTWTDHHKNGHDHYMLKEIYEQKHAIQSTVNCMQDLSANIWDHVGLSRTQVLNLERIHLVGAGTSWHAARIAQFFFEHINTIATNVHLASEFRYMPFFPDTKSVYIVISQSGETADSLEALRLISAHNLPTIALTNIASSTIVREADGFLLTQAGFEVAVASTKAFSTQLAALYWFANRIALERGSLTTTGMEQAQNDLLIAAEILENSIENYKLSIIRTIASMYAKMDRAIFLGRHISYPFAMEAALKLKEISYIFAQCYPAGELKHGALALVDDAVPIFLFSHEDPTIYQKLVSNAQEVKARKGHLIAFAFEGQTELCMLADTLFLVPRINPLLGPLAMTGLMQFLVYHIARQRGCEIDKPRNLAKSVTVE